MANENAYNSPSSTASGTASDIGAQARTDYYFKKALISVRDRMYFMPLADVRAMPKHMGKKIKQDVYIPLLESHWDNLSQTQLTSPQLLARMLTSTSSKLRGTSADIPQRSVKGSLQGFRFR